MFSENILCHDLAPNSAVASFKYKKHWFSDTENMKGNEEVYPAFISSKYGIKERYNCSLFKLVKIK